MKTEIRDGRLIVRDQPLPFWAFYSFFIAGGLVALVVSVRDAPNRWVLFGGAVIGIGNIAGGLTMIRREPASIVELDRGTGEVRVTRWTPLGRRMNRHLLSALRQADVETNEHTDGGLVYRPRLRLADRDIPVSMFWYQRTETSGTVARAINGFLDAPHA